MIPFWLYQIAFGLQLVALAFFLAYAVFPRRELSLPAVWILSFACALQLLFTLLLAWRDRTVPLGNAFEALNFWALLFTALALFLEWRWKLGLLGGFLLPFSALLLLMGFRFKSSLPLGLSPDSGLFLLLHVGLPMAGYALFTASAGLALAYLLAERQLKRGNLSGASYSLPSVFDLEGLLGRALVWGVLCLGGGILWGVARDVSGFLSHLRTDAKMAFALLTLFLFSTVLGLRQAGWRGRRFALLALSGFAVLFFGYYLVNIYAGGHVFIRTLKNLP